MAGIIISAFRRVFGESVGGRTAFIEAAAKAAACNRNPDIGDEAIREGASGRVRAYWAAAAWRGKAAPARRGPGGR